MTIKDICLNISYILLVNSEIYTAEILIFLNIIYLTISSMLFFIRWSYGKLSDKKTFNFLKIYLS